MLETINRYIAELLGGKIQPLTAERLAVLVDLYSDKRPPCLTEEEQNKALIYYILAMLLAEIDGVDMNKITSMRIGEQSMTFGSGAGVDVNGFKSPLHWYRMWQEQMARCTSRIYITKTRRGCCCG